MKRTLLAGAAALASLIPSISYAHHPLGGNPMEAFSDGLLSGIGHPLLGFDHLLFVALVGVAAVYTGRKYLSPAAYIGAMLVGCFAMTVGVGLPAKEFVIGLSLLALGGVVLSGRALGLAPALAVFAAFGLFHGSAFGDAMAAQEGAAGSQVLTGYLIGLAFVQYGIAIAAGWLVSQVFNAVNASTVQARLAGAVVAGAGLLLTLENVEGLVFDIMGWAA